MTTINDKVMAVVDIGTQSLRASFVSTEGEILITRQTIYDEPYKRPQKGYCEQWPQFYYQMMCENLKSIATERSDLVPKCVGLVICSFRDTAALLDANLEPIRPSILWLDQRNAKLEKDYNLKWYEKTLFRLVGMMDTVRFNARRTAAWWLREEQPEIWQKIVKYVPLNAYFNHKLTGNLTVSAADAIGHYPLNFKKGRWLNKCHPKTNVFGIPLEKLCSLTPCGQVIGKLTDAASALTGLPAGLALIASGSDKACEVLGNGCLDAQRITISYGTACTIDLVSKRYIEPQLFLPAYQAAIPQSYNLEVQLYRGFWMIKWLIHNFANAAEIQEAKERNVLLERIFDEKIEKVPAGSNGLVLQPYWGPGLKRPNAKGAIVGFSDIHDKYHIYRATIEGIGYGLREGLEEMRRRTLKNPQAIVVSGGGSGSKIICQITADIFGLPVLKTNTTESATIGCAIAGFLSAGVFTDEKEAVRHMVHYSETFAPNLKNHAVYDQLYSTAYVKIYPRFHKIYMSLKHLN